MKGALWSFLAFILAALPQPLCRLPFVAWALSLAWAVLVSYDHTLPLTRSQRRAMAKWLAVAAPDDPLLVIRQWNDSNPHGAWHG